MVLMPWSPWASICQATRTIQVGTIAPLTCGFNQETGGIWLILCGRSPAGGKPGVPSLSKARAGLWKHKALISSSNLRLAQLPEDL